MTKFRPAHSRTLPADLGLPGKFDSFRVYSGYDQQETIRQIAAAFLFRGKRFVIVNGPPGCGKSLIGAGVRNLLALRERQCRGLFLTISKPLQDQLAGDFRDMAIAKGRNNYRCPEWQSDCGMPQRLGDRCSLERPEKRADQVVNPVSCPYRLAIDEAADRNLACLNYSLWLAFGQYGNPDEIGKFGLMVGDEAHNILDAITDASAISLNRKDVSKLLGMEAGLSLPRPHEAGRKASDVVKAVDISPWCAWATEHLEEAKDKLSKCRKSEIGRRVQLLALIGAMDKLSHMADDPKESQDGRAEAQVQRKLWAPKVESGDQKSGDIRICRVFPSHEVCENLLWRGIPRILLMSGSVSPQIISDLDIPRDQVEYIEITSAFPVKNRPIVYVNSTPNLKMRYDMDDGERRILISRLDQINRIWSEWGNGLIHSNSYEWNDYILRNSKYFSLMISHGRGEVKGAVEKLRRATAEGERKVIVSPALWEGYDFPGELVQWVVIIKVPYLNSKNPLMAARKSVNPKYADDLIGRKFLQGSMRHIRGEKDKGPVFVLDWNWTHFSWRATKERLVPVYYSNAFRRMDKVPTPEQLFGKDLL
jgi:Rad3-related DNA helicase